MKRSSDRLDCPVLEEEVAIQRVEYVEPCEPLKPYKTSKVTYGEDHPTRLVEGSALACISLPDITETLKMPSKWYTPNALGQSPHLSNAQTEVVLHALKAHSKRVSIKGIVYSMGFLLGDGTGVGKTRIIAAIILEYVIRKQTVAIWITANEKLFDDIVNELDKFKIKHYKLKNMGNTPHVITNGVILLTYQGLREPQCYQKLLGMLGNMFSGVVVFDEAHLSKRAHSSKVGTSVLQLQSQLPNAKIVYSSATGASESSHLVYMERLGIWGDDMCFKTFREFNNAAEEFGVPFLELMALDLKRRGVFISRQISYKGVDVRELRPSSASGSSFREIYRRSCDIWIILLVYLRKMRSAATTKKERKKWTDIVKEYYSAALEYFSCIITSSKIMLAAERCCHELRKDGVERSSVVIAVQFTGENGYEIFDTYKWNHGMPYSTAAHILRRILCKADVPVGCPKLYTDKNSDHFIRIGDWKDEDEDVINGAYKNAKLKKKFDGDEGDVFIDIDEDEKNGPARDAIDIVLTREQKCPNGQKRKSAEVAAAIFKGFPQFSTGAYGFGLEEAVQAYQLSWSIDRAAEKCDAASLAKLYHELYPLLPINALDELYMRIKSSMNASSIPDVISNLTGRRHMYVTEARGVPFKKISTKNSPTAELKRFMNGETRVAVISDASSVGISLHSDTNCKNSDRRVHITLQLPWSPDRLIQQLGRTHRSNQLHPPKYFMVCSEIEAEARFFSVVTQRLMQLGAICQGQSQASPVVQNFPVSICSTIGLYAIVDTIELLRHEDRSFAKIWDTLKFSSLTRHQENISQTKATKLVTKFLNRMLFMDPDMQSRILVAVKERINELKLAGEPVCVPIAEYPDSKNKHNVTKLSSTEIPTKHGTIILYEFKIDRILTWDQLNNQLAVNTDIEIIGFRNHKGVPFLVYRSEKGLFAYYPFCKYPVPITEKMKDTARTILGGEALQQWFRFMARATKYPGCYHKAAELHCRRKPNCDVNACVFNMNLLTGPVFSVFDVVGPCLHRDNLQVAVVSFTDEATNMNCKVVGLVTDCRKKDSVLYGIRTQYGI